MPLSYGGAEIVALFCEAILYGAYVVLLYICMSVFWHRYRQGLAVSRPFVVASAILFALVTLHMVIDIVRLVEAFSGATTLEAERYYHAVTAPLSVLKTGVYVAITVVSDALIVYRAFIVWNKNIVVMLLPALLFVADTGTGITATTTLGLLHPTQSYYAIRQQRITLSFFATTLTLNGICTLLISYRIWKAQREFSRSLTQAKISNLDRIAVIVMESGAIYSAALIYLLASYAAQSTNAFTVSLNIIAPIIGIVFSLLIIRVSLGLDKDSSQTEPVSVAVFAPGKSFARSDGTMSTGATFELSGRNKEASKTATTIYAVEGAVDLERGVLKGPVGDTDMQFADPQP